VVGQRIADVVVDAGIVATVAARADAAVAVHGNAGRTGRAADVELLALLAQPVACSTHAAAAELHRIARDIAEFVGGMAGAGGGSVHGNASSGGVGGRGAPFPESVRRGMFKPRHADVYTVALRCSGTPQPASSIG